MKTNILIISLIILFFLASNLVEAKNMTAPAPLYRDPVTDGAADPVLIWNREEKCWWMLYTQRRANLEAAGVAYCYGTPIGIASSDDNGMTWVYRGTLDLKIDEGHNTFWAPDIVYDNGKYHLFVSYIKGVRTSWGGKASIVHFTSDNMFNWKNEGALKLSSDMVIDATLLKSSDGKWRMWYKDETRGAATMMAKSDNLYDWVYDETPALNFRCEGAKAFRFGNYYWMVTDEWHGMRVYRSSDLNTWERQGLILDTASNRKDDGPQGAHGDVIVLDDKAYVFYFTHPGRKTHTEDEAMENGIVPFDRRRSLIQVAPLELKNGTLISDRDNHFDYFLSNPENCSIN